MQLGIGLKILWKRITGETSITKYSKSSNLVGRWMPCRQKVVLMHRTRLLSSLLWFLNPKITGYSVLIVRGNSPPLQLRDISQYARLLSIDQSHIHSKKRHQRGVWLIEQGRCTTMKEKGIRMRLGIVVTKRNNFQRTKISLDLHQGVTEIRIQAQTRVTPVQGTNSLSNRYWNERAPVVSNSIWLVSSRAHLRGDRTTGKHLLWTTSGTSL